MTPEQPQCPQCDTVNSLRPDGPIVDGQRWMCCWSCSKLSRVRLSTGEIVQIGKADGIRLGGGPGTPCDYDY